MPTLSLDDHVLALVAGVLLPLAGALQHRGSGAEPERFTRAEKLTLYWANSLVLVLLAVAAVTVWRRGGGSLDALGLTGAPRTTPAVLLVAAGFLALYAADALRQLRPGRLDATRRRWRRDTPFLPADRGELAHSMVMVVSAAVCEEVVFRGFLISYVTHATGATALGTGLAVALPSAFFAVCHLYQRWTGVAKVFLLSLLFGALYVLSGSLWVPIGLHFVVDLVGVLLGPRLLADDGPASG